MNLPFYEMACTRQTGRTTKLLDEAFQKNAYFVVHQKGMKDYIKNIRPCFNPQMILALDEVVDHFRGRRNRHDIVVDHTANECLHFPNFNEAYHQLRYSYQEYHAERRRREAEKARRDNWILQPPTTEEAE